eukprot:284157-Chlamydomonas_euryale.AAC.1
MAQPAGSRHQEGALFKLGGCRHCQGEGPTTRLLLVARPPGCSSWPDHPIAACGPDVLALMCGSSGKMCDQPVAHRHATTFACICGFKTSPAPPTPTH